MVVSIFLTVIFLQNFTVYVEACDPNNPNYAYYGTNYTVKITSLTRDKDSYMPGDTATVSGTVSLEGVDVYYSSDCTLYSYGQPYTADPSGVVVTLSTGARTAVDSSGAFSFTVPIAADAAAGDTQYTVTATHASSGASDSGTVTLAVGAYSPKLSVTGSSTYYPGDTIVFAGAGWVPGQPVTVQFLGLQAQETGPTFSDQFVIPDNAAEGTLNLLATQAPNLQATTTIVIQLRPLTLTAEIPTSAASGDTVTVTGTVNSNNGGVAGATVTVTYSGYGSAGATGTTDSGGAFAVSFSMPNNEWGKMISAQQSSGSSAFSSGQVSVVATKEQGYKSPSNTVNGEINIQRPVSVVAALLPYGILTSLGVVAFASIDILTKLTATLAVYFGATVSLEIGAALTLPLTGPAVAIGIVVGGVVAACVYCSKLPDDVWDKPQRGSVSRGAVSG